MGKREQKQIEQKLLVSHSIDIYFCHVNLDYCRICYLNLNATICNCVQCGMNNSVNGELCRQTSRRERAGEKGEKVKFLIDKF